MDFKILDELKRADPKRRLAILMRMREKNLSHFKVKVPDLADYLEATGTGRFEVRIDKSFLEVLDRTTGETCHPPQELLPYMRHLGYRYHTGWIEKNTIAPLYRGDTKHGELVTQFNNDLLNALPELAPRIAAGDVHLPPLADGRCFSVPVVFLGIFTGIHIMYYLNTNQPQDILLIEPDLDRFAVSCFFLDYELLDKHFGRRMLMHVGPDLPPDPMNQLVHAAPITAAAWVRLLPAYPEGNFEEALSKISLRWGTLREIFVPFDREVRNLTYAMRNLRDAVPLLGLEVPKLSTGSVIAIVASGPSLGEDLPWLIENQDRLIIFSATSTVRVLQQHGIRIDFQFALDTEIHDDLLAQLKMDPEIPLVAYFKLDPKVATYFNQVFYVVEKYKANPAQIHSVLTGTHPTTGNLAAALAAWLAPSRLLLLGFDLSYRDTMRSHVEGTLYDDDDGIGHVKDTQGTVPHSVASNFPETEGKIVSHAYYDSAKLSLESLCRRLVEAGKEVFNLSDGARIASALPRHSSEMDLDEYTDRSADVEKIKAAFKTDHVGLWQPYEVPGKVRLQQLRDAVLEAVSMDRFDWRTWSVALDRVEQNNWAAASGEDDIRIEVFAMLMRDLLSAWYRMMLLTHTFAEAELLYGNGKSALLKVLDGLEWPDDLEGVA